LGPVLFLTKNSKYQEPNLKQIPMIKFPNTDAASNCRMGILPILERLIVADGYDRARRPDDEQLR
jgi:hypothetical protein